MNRTTAKERHCCELLLQGCDNLEIAKELHIARRTAKAYMHRLFLRFGIKGGGVKRVKLASYLFVHRRELCLAEFAVQDTSCPDTVELDNPSSTNIPFTRKKDCEEVVNSMEQESSVP